MGSVKLKTRNEGRGLHEWDYVPLGEERIVSYQLQNRSKLDESFYPILYEEESDGLVSNGVFPFSEPVLCVYADLDHLIETAGLSAGERKIVDQIMEGYGFMDIAERYGKTRQTIHAMFKRAVVKISQQNGAEWRRTYALV